MAGVTGLTITASGVTSLLHGTVTFARTGINVGNDIYKIKEAISNNSQGSGTNTGKWHKGSYSSAEESLNKHFAKHGAEVGAKDVDQYLRKVESFAQNLKGAREVKISGATEGVYRYYKNGKYIDIIKSTKEIISFGSQ